MFTSFFQAFKTHSKLILRRFGAIFEIAIFGNFATIDFLCFWGAGGLPVGPRWSPEAPGRLLEMSIFSTFFDLLDRRWRSNGRALKREFEQKLLYRCRKSSYRSKYCKKIVFFSPN